MEMNDYPKESLYYIGTKAVLFRPDRKLLLLRITRKNSPDIYWDLPGGRIIDGETPEAALRREVSEETGIDEFTIERHLMTSLSKVLLSGPGNKKVGVVFSLYLCETNSLEESPEDRITMHWLSIEDAVERLKSNPDWPDNTIQTILELVNSRV
jgi:nucleoside triphosphatase